MKEQIVLGLHYIFLEWVFAFAGVAIIVFLLWFFISKNNEFLLCVRNVLRNKRRSIITLLAIAAAVSGNLLLGSYFLSMFAGLREFTIRSQTGHIVITKKDYLEKGQGSSSKYVIENAGEIISEVKADESIAPYIDVITRQVKFSGLISIGDKSLEFLGTGVEADGDKKLSVGDRYVSGKRLRANKPNEIVLGAGLANQLQAKVGDDVTLITTLPGGGMNALDAQVRGTLQSFSKSYSDVIVKTNITYAQSLSNVQGVNTIVFVLHNTKDVPVVKERIKTLIKQNPQWNIQVYDWYQLQNFYQEVQNYFNSIFTVVSVLLFGLTVVLVLNTMMMSVFERFSEFGTMRSIGVKQKQLVSMVLIEGIVLGIIGVIFGVALSYGVGHILYVMKIQVPPPPGQTSGYPLNLIPQLHKQGLELLFISCFSTIAIACVAAFFPGLKAAKLKIIDCLRFE